jgi:hypothetical protein
MARKSDFTVPEWEVLRDAPHAVTLAVAAAGASGVFGSLKEAFAPAAAILEAAKGKNELLREVCQRDEIKGAQKSLRAAIDIKDPKGISDQLQTLAADKARAAAELLSRKHFTDDLEAYRSCLVGIAERTAKAAKEGSFFGFGGEWVTEGERVVMTRITKALQVQST